MGDPWQGVGSIATAMHTQVCDDSTRGDLKAVVDETALDLQAQGFPVRYDLWHVCGHEQSVQRPSLHFTDAGAGGAS